MIDPKELLYSIPTLNDGIPAIESHAVLARESEAALIHEDDWRQEEFTPVANRAFVLETLSQLQSHRAVHAQGLGFREVLVRDEPPVPLAASGINRDELRPILDASVIALYFTGSQPARIRGGFALPLPDVGFVYGQESDGVVVALGIGLVGSGVGEVAQVANLSGRFDLLFVDWIRGIVIEPGDHAGFRAWIDAIIYRDPDPEMW